MTYRAYAKVNIFLKIVGKREDYHEIISRFMAVESLFDTLELKSKKTDREFELVGNFGCDLKSNTIFKAYENLKSEGYKQILEEFFSSKALHVEKNIPSFAGLGGGSSDAATFLLMLNKELSLGLSKDKLAQIGSRVGADVPFFIYELSSANVSGIGEIVEEFDEEPLKVEVMTPNVECDTAKVYSEFRKNYMVEPHLAKKMAKMSSFELLDSFSPKALNDLLKPALKVYPQLKEYLRNDWFFSGSGSSFFRILEE